MHRRPVLDLLARYEQGLSDADDLATVARIRALVSAHADCLQRTCLPGHLTGAAWIVTPDRRRCLLTHHRKLGRWLQLGGHADGDPRLEQVALREAREESGLVDLELVTRGGVLVPLDVDVHEIPARRDEPRHEHHDIRFLVVADDTQDLVVSDESHELRWVEVADLERFSADESVLRMARKAERWR